MAYPGLRARAWKLTEGLTFHQTAQVHFRLAGEFLFALHRLDLSTPNVASRLISGAYDHASGREEARSARHGPQSTAATQDGLWHRAHEEPQAGPRAVLDRLIRQTSTAKDGQRITELHATLIARTYLDGEKLKQVAAELGMTESNASKHRTRAEMLIARHLGHPGLTQPPQPA